MMRSSKLRRRLLLSLLWAGLATTLVSGLVFAVFGVQERINHMRNFADHTAEILAHRIRLGDLNPDNDSWAHPFLNDDRIARIAVYTNSGATLIQVPEGETIPALTKTLGLEKDWPSVFGTEGVVVAVAVNPRTVTDRAIFLLLTVCLLSGGAGLLAYLISNRIHRQTSAQLLDLARTVNAVSTLKNYSIRALRRSDDEIGLLADALNQMLAQIELQDIQLKREFKRAEAAKVAKSQFLATVSHEIRTPINGILGMTQLLLDTRLNSEQDDIAHTVSRSAEGLLSIINDILDFSKGEAGRHQIKQVSFSPSQITYECVETVAIVACEKEIELVCQVDEKVPAYLMGDPARLRQVLLNLLSNAMKFTTKGEVVVRLAVEKINHEQASICFEVEDTGIGIPEDRLDRLFKSFSQVDTSANRKYGGTGLGLAISKQLVEAMGGSISVRTRENHGSLFGFNVTLPIDRKISEVGGGMPPRSLHVLIADPNTTSRRAIAQMLRAGNTVETAAGGPEGRKLLLKATKSGNPFDMVLLDVRLGDAFLAPFTSDVDPVPTPLILLAPINQLASASAVNWHGRVSCVAKPVRRQDLLWCISESLRPELHRVPAALPVEARVEPSGVANRTILVAEDNPVNQKITTKFLDKIGVQWRLVGNGQEAVEAYRNGEIDLILMDVQMPIMDGLEATTAIRRLEVLSETHIPIVALTANVLEDDRNQARCAGFDDYLVKPIKTEELELTIRKWITRGQHSVVSSEPAQLLRESDQLSDLAR